VTSAPAPRPRAVAAPRGLPRLFAGLAAGGETVGLDAHLDRWGAHPARQLGPDLIGLLEESGLRGRGGGGFPAGRKLAAVASRSGSAVVVVNAVEGEPTSGKDRALIRHLPHLVLDGAALVAEAAGAREALVAVGGASELEVAALTSAIGARARRRLDGRLRLRAVAAPRAFVAGEETALVRFLDGGPAKPTFTPPRPFERGVGGAPTLVQNAETVAHAALVARFGSGWFREVGTADEPGSALVSLTGAVARAGVYEIALGSTLGELLEQAGGASEPLRAFLVGGYFGGWLDAAAATPLRLLDSALAPHGAALGARAIVALPADGCGVVETARVARYLADESAGQCGPCVFGLDTIAGALVRLARRERSARTAELGRWLEQVRGRGACRHPDGAVRFVASALEVFADEIDLHLRGRCSGGNRLVLPVPRRERRR
jgi:NADH:ubiquinone oxidoreductase subunit F (NADH-binding)